ncbi:MaoC family dehydratase [Halomarina oriensis]|uniref:Acyl dehydratase n=1 Tax=Halomarina oriensis TaxID=671145 RepID=A0A6B0GQ32_9EURY|nr:MaoC family dehydratase [Halomarina oriensis]MWG34773.1 acyl dehydratase [Halomarina oriensis]
MSYTPPSLFEPWVRTSEFFVDSVVAANRATAAAFGVPVADDDTPTGDTDTEDRLVPDGDLPEWDTETTVESWENVSVGDSVRFTKTVTERDVERFAAASGDTNPLHLDETYAADTRFEGRIAHGTLVAGLISAALARYPGNVIYLSQDLEFLKPVRIGDRITADVEIVESFGDDRYRLTTEVLSGDATVIDGEAVVLIDRAPADE